MLTIYLDSKDTVPAARCQIPKVEVCLRCFSPCLWLTILPVFLKRFQILHMTHVVTFRSLQICVSLYSHFILTKKTHFLKIDRILSREYVPLPTSKIFIQIPVLLMAYPTRSNGAIGPALYDGKWIVISSTLFAF